MTLSEKQARYRWFKSQQRWHERRNGKWHINQARWYRKQAQNVYSIFEIIEMTIERNAPQLAKQMQATNALYSRLIANRRASPQPPHASAPAN